MISLPAIPAVRPNRILPFISAALGLLSISTAHYIGYTVDLPSQIIMVGGLTLAAGVTAPFLFYFFASIILARILAYAISSQLFLQTLFYPIAECVLNRSKHINARRIVRSYVSAANRDRAMALPLQAIIAFLLMLFLYLPGHQAIPAIVFLVLLTLITLGIFARMGVFLYGPLRYFKFLADNRRKSLRKRGLRQVFIGAASLAVLLALLAGLGRIKYVSTLGPVSISQKNYNGVAKILIYSEGQSLLLETKGSEKLFVILTPNSLVSVAAETYKSH